MDIASEIRQRLTTREVAEHYGFTPGRGGFIQCPFHQGDRTASLKLYDARWKCFGCGKGGSVIDFVMELKESGVDDACRLLDADFGLCLYREVTFKERRSSVRQRAERREEQEHDELSKWYSDKQYFILCNYRRWLAHQESTKAVEFDLAYMDRLLGMFLGQEKRIEFDAAARVNALLSKHPNRGDYDLHSGDY